MKRILPAACIVGVLIPFFACFYKVLFLGEQFAYRDAAHFYYPLYKTVQDEWTAGRWPLWDVHENSGMPLLGNPTAAVLYPGKAIYAAFPYPWAARIYTIAHVALAFGGTWFFLRGLNVSRTGSLIAALSYSFAGPILFQYCNIVFLVGAAWAPFGFRGIDRWLRRKSPWGLFELAGALAMQTLGGDPQIAYLTGVCAGGYALGLYLLSDLKRASKLYGFLAALACLLLLATGPLLYAGALGSMGPRDRSNFAADAPKYARVAAAFVWVVAGVSVLLAARSRKTIGKLSVGLAGLAFAAVLAGLLASAQLLPVLEYAAGTSRAADEGPHEIYPFSLPVYRAIEFVWPHFFGKLAGTNRYWLDYVPPISGERRVWTPSLYLGGLTIVLALSAFGSRKGQPWRGWLSAILLLSFLCSLGSYGSPVWWARETTSGARLFGPHDPPDRAFRVDGLMPDGDGSLYGVFARLLPGFNQFRYPSKLLTLSCLAIASLAGLGWDGLLEGGRNGRAAKSVALFIFIASLLAVWRFTFDATSLSRLFHSQVQGGRLGLWSFPAYGGVPGYAAGADHFYGRLCIDSPADLSGLSKTKARVRSGRLAFGFRFGISERRADHHH